MTSSPQNADSQLLVESIEYEDEAVSYPNSLDILNDITPDWGNMVAVKEHLSGTIRTWFGNSSPICRFMLDMPRASTVYYEVVQSECTIVQALYRHPPWTYAHEMVEHMPAFQCFCDYKKTNTLPSMDEIADTRTEYWFQQVCAMNTAMKLYEHYLRIEAMYPCVVEVSQTADFDSVPGLQTALSSLHQLLRFKMFGRILTYSDVLIEKRWIAARLYAIGDFIADRISDVVEEFEISPKTSESHVLNNFAVVMWQNFVNLYRPYLYRDVFDDLTTKIPFAILEEVRNRVPAAVKPRNEHSMDVECELYMSCKFFSAKCHKPLGAQ